VVVIFVAVQGLVIMTINLIDSEYLRVAFDLLGIWVLCYGNEIFVEKFDNANVFLNILLILANRTTQTNVLEKFKYELLLILV